MINVLVHHEVADYTAWKVALDSGFDWRRENGERSCRIFHSAENVNDLTLLFEWESLEKARAFIASDELKTRMASAGVKRLASSRFPHRGAQRPAQRCGLSVQGRCYCPPTEGRTFGEACNRFPEVRIQEA